MKSTVVFETGWGVRSIILSVVVTCAIPDVLTAAPGQTPEKRPSFSRVTRIVKSVLADQEVYQPGDLINRSDVERVLDALAANGWQPPDHKQLLADTLPASHALVKILDTKRGVKFMRKVKDDKLIYDRMDRVSRVRDGKRMLADMSKLPDGEKYAKIKPPPGVPDFLDLLPKRGSSKLRSIEDYKKPTGRIYTEKELLARLEQSYQGKSKAECQQEETACTAKR